jgi:hypothetical protein
MILDRIAFMKSIFKPRHVLIVGAALIGWIGLTSLPLGGSRDRAATVTGVKMRDDPLLGRTVNIDVALDGGRQVVATSSSGALPKPGSIILVRETAPLVGAARFTWDGRSVDAITPKK